MKGETAPAKPSPGDKVSALRSALRAAPKKRAKTSRSPLKAAVAQLLPDLLACRAKGYSGVELAEVMGEHGFTIAARTLTRYINELRARPSKAHKRRTAAVRAESKATKGARRAQKIVVESATAPPPRPDFFVAKPLARPRRNAQEVLGHRFDDDV